MLRQESVLDVELLSTITKASCYESERYTVTEAATGGVSIKKGVVRNFAKFTGKHLCQSFFFNKVPDWGLQLH